MGFQKKLNKRWGIGGKKSKSNVSRGLVKILSHFKGDNRAIRRGAVASARQAPERNKNKYARDIATFEAQVRQDVVARRVKRATMRRLEREKAALSGKPVKYSIA